jgi:homoserine kinase
MRFVARVPATSANLGPGFDCFALALDLCNEVTVDTQAEPGASWEGEGAGELPRDGGDAVSRAMRLVAERAGEELPPFHLHGKNRIPLERGLGSSSAAAVAGVAIAGRWLGIAKPVDPREAIYEVAADLEGHPDNAAAAVFGGLTLARGDGPPIRLDPHPDLRPVLLIPHAIRLPTEAARRALSPEVSRGDAVFNVQRAALAVVALTERPELLSEALQDRLHQDVRLALLPEVRAAFDGIREAGLPVCVSGAGPSLLVFEQDRRRVPDPAPGWRVVPVAPRSAGVEVETG